MLLSEKICEQRKQLKLSQEELSKILNVSRSAVANWESGRNYPDITMIIKLSDEFGLSLDELLREDSNIKNIIEEDSKNKKLLKSKVKILSLLVLLLSVLLLCILMKNINVKQISKESQIRDFRIENSKIVINLNIPSYYDTSDYLLSNSIDSNALELELIISFHIGNNNKNYYEIPIKKEEIDISKFDHINITYDGRIIYSYKI